jgi:hypothetical protein
MTETTARIETDRSHALATLRVLRGMRRPEETATSPESVTTEMTTATDVVVSEMTADVIATMDLNGLVRVTVRRMAGIGVTMDAVMNVRLLVVVIGTEDGSVVTGTRTASAGVEEIALGMMIRPTVTEEETRTRTVGMMTVKHGPSGVSEVDVSAAGLVERMTLEIKRTARIRTRIRPLRGWKPTSLLAVVEAFWVAKVMMALWTSCRHGRRP